MSASSTAVPRIRVVPTGARFVATSIALAVGGVLATPVPAAGQDTPVAVQPYRFTVEPYLSHMWFDRGGDADRAGIGGFGVRVQFNRSDAAEAVRGVRRRATAGVFATFTGEQNGVSTQHIGAELQSSLLPAAAFRGTLDPFISIGAGALRVNPTVGESQTNFTLTPGVGTRIPLVRGFGLRGDLRAPVVFGSDTRVHFAAEGGVYLSF